MKKADAAAFDQELATKAGLVLKRGSALRLWLDLESAAEKREVAGAVIREAAEDEFKRIGVACDRVRLRRLAEDLKHFESVIIGARSGLGKKFYRDHLNHGVRVFLLEKVLEKELANVVVSDGGGYGLEGLLHDVGYPVQSVRSVVEELGRGIARTYGDHYLGAVTVSTGSAALIKPLVEADAVPDVDLTSLLREAECLNHGLVGACAMLSLCAQIERRGARVKNVCSAIASHDSSMHVGIRLVTHGRAAFLVLADELQEWGRPAGHEPEAVVPRLLRFELGGRRVECEYSLDVEAAGFALCGVEAKYRNLSRVDLGGLIGVAMQVHLPRYRNLVDEAFATPRMCEGAQSLMKWRRKLESTAEQESGGWSLRDVWFDPNATEVVVCRGAVPRSLTIRGRESGWDLMGEDGTLCRVARGKVDELSRRVISWIEAVEDYWMALEEGLGIGADANAGVERGRTLEARERRSQHRRAASSDAWVSVRKTPPS